MSDKAAKKKTSKSSKKVPAKPKSKTTKARKKKPVRYVGIGASAGGLEPIQHFFDNMPSDSGMGFIIVQHLSPNYKSLMGPILSRHTSMPVSTIENKMIVEANNIYLIPPKKNLIIKDGTLFLTEQDRGVQNLAVNIFMRSLAEDQGDKAVGIILSGTGSDGTVGMRYIKEAGGVIMAQDEESAQFGSMPLGVSSSNLADFVMNPTNMPGKLLAIVNNPYTLPEKPESEPEQSVDDLQRIFFHLQQAYKVDFRYYKTSTINRRLKRRININQLSSLAEYADFVENSNDELDALYQDLLINVTSFFRDRDAYDILMKEYLPDIIRSKAGGELRIWIPACSTGEEAYTVAILVHEYMELSKTKLTVKIFATDLDNVAVEKAGLGMYPFSIKGDVPAHYLARYFTVKNEHYQINSEIRKMIVFSRHNLTKDAPFTGIDFLSCRNMLIYIETAIQQKILDFFNFSLNAGGVLMLGPSESMGEHASDFEKLNSKWKIYRCKGKKRRLSSSLASASPIIFNVGDRPYANTSRSLQTKKSNFEEQIRERLLRLLSGYYVPLILVANHQGELRYIMGNSEGFIQVPFGEVDYNVAKMADPELSIPISTGIQKTIKNGEECVFSNIPINRGERKRMVNLRIRLLPETRDQERLVALIFEESQLKETSADSEGSTDSNFDVSQAARQRIDDLEHELQFNKESLQATVEELETTNEELQSTNEELLSSNEELQSTNEELQSVNEELYTVNAEYQSKIVELTDLNSQFDNLMASTDIATIFLDQDHNIRMFTPACNEIFHVMEHDLGRPFLHINHTIGDVSLMEYVERVDREEIEVNETLQAEGGKWYLVRGLPYRGAMDEKAGVVLSFIDITELRMKDMELCEARVEVAKYSRAVEALTEGRHLLLRAESEERLFEDLCHILVEKVGYRLAWIGLKEDDEEQTVNPVAAAGDESNYLSGLRVSWGDNKLGKGPAGKAIRSGELQFFRNIEKDKNFAPWRKEAKKHGFGSAVGIPLLIKEETIGVLMLYADAPDAFDEDEVKIIEDLASDLTFGIDSLRTKAERDAAVEEMTKAMALTERANKAKSEFLANMSHELRTPLNAIIGFSDMLSTGMLGEISDKQLDCIKDINEGGEHLLLIINDILDLSKIESGKEVLNNSDVLIEDLISSSYNFVKTQAIHKKINIDIDLDKDLTHVYADPFRLKQVLINLLSNAIKFTKEKGKVSLCVSPGNPGGILFSVKDTGIGIKKEDMEDIYEPFHQIESAMTKQYKGTGLGLDLSKKIVELHGGRLWVESKFGKGSTFFFSIPGKK